MVIKMIKNKAQVTIFIIIAILIVALVLLFFLLRGSIIPGEPGGYDENPNIALGDCLDVPIKDGIELISSQGGNIEPLFYKDFKFSDEPAPVKITYLCYNVNDYIPCINQEPMLIQHLKDEMYNYISDDVKRCFDDIASNLDRQGYTVDATYRDFEIDLISKKVIVDIDAKLIITKGSESKTYDGFKITESSRFYDLALVVQEIVNQEVKYCNFENLGYMLLHPNIKITEKTVSNESMIYIVKSRKTEEEFTFAVRSCALKI